MKRASEVAPADSIRHLTGRKLDRAIIVVTSVAVVPLLTNTFMWHKGKAATGAAVASVPEKSMAMLPPVNTNGAQDQQSSSDGLSDNLITTLSQHDRLEVIGRGSSFLFRGSNESRFAAHCKRAGLPLLTASEALSVDQIRASNAKRPQAKLRDSGLRPSSVAHGSGANAHVVP